MHVNSEHISIGSRAKSGAVYLGASQVSRLAFTVISTIIISRFLTPSDYGVIAMAAPITIFVSMFQDLGLSTATIQKKTILDSESSALFWINVSASIIVTIVLVSLSPAVSLFYRDPRAGYVTALSSLGLLASGVSMQHGALLDRDMRFAALGIVDVGSAAVTFVASVIAAILMRSYWALIIGMLAGALTQAVLLWTFSSWRPSWRISFKGAGTAASFGSHITGFNLANFFARNADNVLLARMTGAFQLGLYDRSYKLMMLPIQNLNAPINRLFLPLLSRLQDDPPRYRRSVIIGMRSVVLLSTPGILVATAFSGRIIPFLLGKGWTAAGPIFFWLGLTGLIQPVTNMTGNLFVSTGRSAMLLRWGFFSAVLTVSGFVIGLRWGAQGVAASLFLTNLLRVPLAFELATRGTSISAKDLYSAQLEPIGGAALAVFIISHVFPRLEVIPLLLIALPSAYIFAVLSSLISKSGRLSVRWGGETLKNALGSTSAALCHWARFLLRIDDSIV